MLHESAKIKLIKWQKCRSWTAELEPSLQKRAWLSITLTAHVSTFVCIGNTPECISHFHCSRDTQQIL